MLISLLPSGSFRPASWRILLIVFAVALLGAGMLCYMLIYAAEFPSS